MIVGVAHTALLVREYDEAKRFYTPASAIRPAVESPSFFIRMIFKLTTD